VVGLQWGDEAKGKIVDLLCDDHDVVVRYQGGANAGHTVVHEGSTYKLSLVPTGILRPHVHAVIANGVVIHPPALLKEIATLESQGVSFQGRLHVGDRAHVILPYHLAEERLTEESSSAADHLGTTRRGIGPCYKDKVGRVHGVRVADLNATVAHALGLPLGEEVFSKEGRPFKVAHDGKPEAVNCSPELGAAAMVIVKLGASSKMAVPMRKTVIPKSSKRRLPNSSPNRP